MLLSGGEDQRRAEADARLLIAQIGRAPGYFRPDDFLAMFRFVREKAYETKSFRDFLKARAS